MSAMGRKRTLAPARLDDPRGAKWGRQLSRNSRPPRPPLRRDAVLRRWCGDTLLERHWARRAPDRRPPPHRGSRSSRRPNRETMSESRAELLDVLDHEEPWLVSCHLANPLWRTE